MDNDDRKVSDASSTTSKEENQEVVDKVAWLSKVAPDGPLDEDKGLLSILGDPIGRVLATGLKPFGMVLGEIGNPPGEALLKVEKLAKDEIGYSKEDNGLTDAERPGGARIGGNTQTGSNPLGL